MGAPGVEVGLYPEADLRLFFAGFRLYGEHSVFPPTRDPSVDSLDLPLSNSFGELRLCVFLASSLRPLPCLAGPGAWCRPAYGRLHCAPTSRKPCLLRTVGVVRYRCDSRYLCDSGSQTPSPGAPVSARISPAFQSLSPARPMRTLLAIGFALALTVTGLGYWAHRPPTPIKGTVDSLVVDKADRTLRVYQGRSVTATYPVALSIDPTGPKRFQGDRRVPVGQYHVAFHLEESIAYKALRISYPNPQDRRYARSRGRDPGGLIEIHGLHGSMAWMGRLHAAFNYTLGCVAVTNAQMDELYRHVPDGTPVRFVAAQAP